MIYTNRTKRAMLIAYNAHHGQFDKSGMPYIYHPIHLAESMESEDATIVALLHDVVEDTHITIDDLKLEGFSDEVYNALNLLTHKDETPYLEYIENLKNNKIAVTVKLADLKHNSDITRLNNVDDYVIERISKYKKAIELLEN